MAQTLLEYARWLDGRDLIWPAPPKFVPASATPAIKPLRGIKAVTWSVYGTLLRISEGKLLQLHPDEKQMQVALDKTIQEFNMWQSMTRRPGAPWAQLYEQYKQLVETRRLVSVAKGDIPEVDSSALWQKLFERLGEKYYDYNVDFYGDLHELSDKVAYFFHASLQGVEAAPNALAMLQRVAGAGMTQTLLSNGQAFTLVQLLRALERGGTLPPAGELLAFDCLTLSFQEGVRAPSKSLYRACLERFAERGIAPEEILHVGARLKDELAVAKQLGMRTALYAADKTSLRASKADIQNPELRPDRLLTDLAQVAEVLAIA